MIPTGVMFPGHDSLRRRRPNVGARPNWDAGIGMKRVHIVRFGHRDDHRTVWATLDVERLRVHVPEIVPSKFMSRVRLAAFAGVNPASI